MQFLSKSVFILNPNKYLQLARIFSTKSTKQKKQTSNMPRLPDRWADYTNCGKRIEGTRIICFKTPLRNTYFQNNEQPGVRWGVEELIQTIPNLGLVIDLTYSTKYYDPSELTSRDIDHQKILCEGHVIPRPPVVKQFIDVIDEFLEHNPENDMLIGVHCTHGLNRTGYLVCRYMIDRLLFDRLTTIDLFNSARGNQMERENYVNHLKDPQDYKNTRHEKGKNRNNREMHTISGQTSTMVAEPLPGQRNTYFNPGPSQNSGYSVRRSELDNCDTDIGTRQDYGEFGFKTPQRHALANELHADISKKQNSDDTRKRSSHRREKEKDRNIGGFATEPGQGCIFAEPFPGQRNVYFNPGPGRNSGFRIPKLGQKDRESDKETRQNETNFAEPTEQQIASGTELNREPMRISGFRIPKLRRKSRDSGTATRQNEYDSAIITDQRIASGNEMKQNEGGFGARPKSFGGEVRARSGRFSSSGPRPTSRQIDRDGRTGYDSHEFKSEKSHKGGRESNPAGLDANGDDLRRAKGQNRKARNPTNTSFDWRDRD